jgi:hypothetical protein
MSREAVEAIIGKAVLDSEFRKALFTSPDEALAGYDLTEQEMAGLKAIDAESIEALAGSLDERISKSIGVMPPVRPPGPWPPMPGPEPEPPSTGPVPKPEPVSPRGPDPITQGTGPEPLPEPPSTGPVPEPPSTGPSPEPGPWPPMPQPKPEPPSTD